MLEKEVDCGFALVRPPGHHAMRVVHGSRGFCNINNEAIMIEHMRQTYGVDRVAVVDTDCHHGDGTQNIYWHDPDTLFISLHQDGRTLYPGSGSTREIGGPNALGASVNIPLPPKTSEEGFLYVVDRVVLPILAEFKPEIIINSAGQDNHYSDPITQMNFCAQGYAKLTDRLKPHIAVLEGGYSIEGALPYVNVGIILALAGVDYSYVREPDYDPEEISQTGEVRDLIVNTCEKLLQERQDIDSKRKKYLEGKEFVRRSKTIFYDTDNIIEEQKETIRVCGECAGVLRIAYSASTKNHLLGVQIPRKSCSTCQEIGREWFEEGNVARFNLVCLQDRVTDEYQVKRR